jgi:tRNA G18 (ribose-2'-O)-methylase SpoU
MEDRKKKNMAELTRCSATEYRAMDKYPLRVLADNVRSMHNVGSLFRTSDAFAVEEIVLAGISGCPPHPEISKTALGAEESVAWRHVDDAVQECRLLQSQGWKVCVLEQTHNSVELSSFTGISNSNGEMVKYLLVVGNEVEGVNQQIVDLADVILEIPQCGVKHSLNVAASGAIALHHLFCLLRH